MKNNKGHGMTRKQPMALQLQQQWRRDGASEDHQNSDKTSAHRTRPDAPAANEPQTTRH